MTFKRFIYSLAPAYVFFALAAVSFYMDTTISKFITGIFAGLAAFFIMRIFDFSLSNDRHQPIANSSDFNYYKEKELLKFLTEYVSVSSSLVDQAQQYKRSNRNNRNSSFQESSDFSNHDDNSEIFYLDDIRNRLAGSVIAINSKDGEFKSEVMNCQIIVSNIVSTAFANDNAEEQLTLEQGDHLKNLDRALIDFRESITVLKTLLAKYKYEYEYLN